MKSMPLVLLLLITLSFAGTNADSTMISTKSDTTTISIDEIKGRYRGVIESGGVEVPAITTFFESDGELRGKYTFDEEDGRMKGRLTQFEVIDSHTIRCDWKDIYGTGTLFMQFDEPYSRFTGYWVVDGSSHEHIWSGSKL